MPFYDQMVEATVRHGARLLVLDSLHDLFAGDENRRGQARQFIGALRAIALKIDGTVVLTAHPSLSGMTNGSGTSGSTAWNNAVRARHYLTKPNDENSDANERILRTMKSNYGPPDGRLNLLWRDGVFVRPDDPRGVFGTIHRRSAETVFLDAHDKLTKQGVNLCASPSAHNYGPTLIVKSGVNDKLKKHELAGAMQRLFADGKIRSESYGRPSEPRTRIVKVTDAKA
jgi:RecA-family ATPase